MAAQSRSGPYHRTDASVPLHALPPFLDEALARLAAELPDGRPVAYGHVARCSGPPKSRGRIFDGPGTNPLP